MALLSCASLPGFLPRRIQYPLVLQSRGQLDPIKLITALRDMQKEATTANQVSTYGRRDSSHRLELSLDW